MGDKTTNAKARTAQTTAVKEMVRRIEKSQSKQTVNQKPRRRSARINPIKFEVKADQTEDLGEPEYAPAPAESLPYESDVLPNESLNTRGLQPENLLRGFYDQFCNPTNGCRIACDDRDSGDEKRVFANGTFVRNERQLNGVGWSILDNAEDANAQRQAWGAARGPGGGQANSRKGIAGRHAPACSSRTAVSVFAVRSDCRKPALSEPVGPISSSDKSGKSLNEKGGPGRQISVFETSQKRIHSADTTLRTTTGHRNGRAARNVLRQEFEQSAPAICEASVQSRPLPMIPDQQQEDPSEKVRIGSHPYFMDIFASDDDDGDESLSSICGPYQSSDDDVTFELKLNA